MAAKPSMGTPPANLPALVPSGSHAGNAPLLLKKLVALAGSQEKCHLRLMSSTVSKYHALVITGPDGVYIRDLASRTKVLVNGQTVTEAWLQDTDQVQIGKFLFQFTSPQSGPPMPVPAPSAGMVVGGRTSPEPIHGLVVLIGRQNGCDIKLRDDSVSSRHAVIFEAAGKRYIRDLNSRTGTYVNGNKIHLEEIESIDEIRIGETKLNLKPFHATEVEAESLPEPLSELEPLPFETEAPSDESEPLPVETEATPVESEPLPFELEARSDESEPLAFTTEAQSDESEPLSVETEATRDEPEPLGFTTEATPSESEPLPLETEATSDEPEPLPVEIEAEERAVEQPISLAPPDEPIPLAPEPAPEPALRSEPQPRAQPGLRHQPIFSSQPVPESAAPPESALAPEPAPPVAPARAPTPARPPTPVAPRIELIPMHPPSGSVIQLRPASPIPWPPRQAAPPPPAEPAKPAAQAAPPTERLAPAPPPPESTKPVAPIEVRSTAPPPPEPVAPPPIQLRPATPLSDEPAKSQSPAPPPMEVRAPASRAAEPAKPAPPIEAPEPAHPTSPPIWDAAPAPPQPLDEARSWSERANIKRVPPGAAEPGPQRTLPRVAEAADAQSPVVDVSAQSKADNFNSATIDEESAHQASEPPLIATGLNLDVDRQSPRSDDMLFVEEDFAQALPLPPEILARPARAAQPPVAKLPARPRELPNLVKPPMPSAPAAPEPAAAPPPKSPAVESASARYQKQPDIVEMAKPPIPSIPAAPTAAAPLPPKSPAFESVSAQKQPDIAELARPPILSAPAAPKPAAALPPKSPAFESASARFPKQPDIVEMAKPPIPSIPADELDLDIDQQSPRSDDMLFEEADFAPDLPLPPEIFGPPPVRAVESPGAKLHVGPQELADVVKPPIPSAPAAHKPAAALPPKSPVVESPIAGLDVRPEAFAQVVKPPIASAPAVPKPAAAAPPKSPLVESPIAGLQVRPEDFAGVVRTAGSSAPSSAAAAASIPPKAPAETPIAGLQIRREDFAPADQPASREAKAPVTAAPSAVAKAHPQESVHLPQPASPGAPAKPAPAATTPPPPPARTSSPKSPAVEAPIPGLQIRPEDFAPAAKVDLRESVRSETPTPAQPPAAAPQVRAAAPRPTPPRVPQLKHDELLDLDEPWQPALDLDLELPALPTDDKSVSIHVDELADTAFTEIVENFSGDATGPLIETTPPVVEFESASVSPPMHSVSADEGSIAPPHAFAAQTAEPAIEPAHHVGAESTEVAEPAEIVGAAQPPGERHTVAQESVVVEEPIEAVATADAAAIAPPSAPDELPAADFPEPQIEEPAIVEPQAVTVPPPAEVAATTDTASVTPPSPSSAETVASPAAPRTVEAPLSAVGGAGPVFIANLDHFLGGMPMKLPDLPKASTTARRFEVSYGDRPPPSAPQPEPVSPALDAGPKMIQTPPPPKVVRTARSQPSKAAPFATTSNISADQGAATAESSQEGAADDKASERLTSIFEGLAMSPIHEKDVFSDFEATAMNDAAFGGARLSRADDYVLPETPELASRLSSDPIEDFAESEFWERTDEQEGVPPMGVPKPQDYVVNDQPVAGDAAAPTEESPVPPQTPIETPAGMPAGGGQNIPPENLPRQRPRSPGAPPSQHPVEPPERTRARRRKLIPFLMLAMLLSMAAAYAAIWFGIRPRSHVYGSMTFLNYDWVASTGDGIEFESTQRRLLAADTTRKHAVELLQQQNSQISAGFLQIPDLYGRVIRSISLSAMRVNGMPQTQIKLNYDGGDEAGDRTRMGALLQAMIDQNAQKLDTAHQVQEGADRARRAVDDAAAQIEQTRTQIASLQRTVDQDPSAERLAAIAQRESELERARFAAEDAVDTDRANLSRLQAAAVAAHVGEGTGSTTRPGLPASDPQLQEMRRQMLDLNARLQAAKRAQTTGVTQARNQLEDAVKQFNDELGSAGGVLDDSSALKQFVNSAKDSQNRTRELITMLMVDGEDLEKQLEDTRREAADLIQTRQQDIWSADARLQDLIAKRDSAQHRYNANVGEGINDPVILDPLQTEIATLNDQIKTRQGQLDVGPSEVKLAKSQARVIDSLRNRLQKEKQQTDGVLDPLEQQLKDLDPTVAALPDAQRALAQQLRQRLATLNEARRTYAGVVGGGATAPSAIETDLQKQIDDLKARYDEHQANLAEQIQKSVGDQSATQLADAQHKLDADKQAVDAAKNTYNAARIDYDNLTARHTDAQAALASMQLGKDQLVQQTRALDQLRHDQEQKKSEAEHSFDIKPFTESDVTSTATDPRRDYCIYAIVGLAVVFAFLVLAASQPASGEVPVGSLVPQPASDAKQPTGEQAHHDPDDEEMLTTA